MKNKKIKWNCRRWKIMINRNEELVSAFKAKNKETGEFDVFDIYKDDNNEFHVFFLESEKNIIRGAFDFKNVSNKPVVSGYNLIIRNYLNTFSLSVSSEKSEITFNKVQFINDHCGEHEYLQNSVQNSHISAMKWLIDGLMEHNASVIRVH